MKNGWPAIIPCVVATASLKADLNLDQRHEGFAALSARLKRADFSFRLLGLGYTDFIMFYCGLVLV